MKEVKDKYVFEGDCVEFDITGISLCEEEHHGKEVHLAIKFGLDIPREQLDELIKLNDPLALRDEQFWRITIEKNEKRKISNDKH